MTKKKRCRRYWAGGLASEPIPAWPDQANLWRYGRCHRAVSWQAIDNADSTSTRRCSFFFSSRRRHPSCYRDWSSDVCSSDPALTRVQGLLGPEAVLTAVPSGGRGVLDRVRLVPWGDERLPARPLNPPWPGRLPAPAPASVLPEPVPAAVYADDGSLVGVTGRLAVTAPPARVTIGGAEAVEVTGWAGPWPVDERWWAPTESRCSARFQLLLADGRALLMSLVDDRWLVEAVYD